jgi:uncharacterized protein YndB with AHSA1/START domain
MNDDLTISIERTFRAPPEKVFDAWTDPAKLARWFGPDGFTTTTHELDLRAGGEWRHTMRGPDGTEYPNRIRFVEVACPSRLVYDHLSSPPFRTTVTFEPYEAGGTRMRFRMAFPHEDAFRVATEIHGAKEGAKQTLARLADLVDGPGFVLEREFRAAPERVWAMWTTSEGVMRWWAPSAKEMGYEFRVLEMDVRPGGRYRFEMKGRGHELVNAGTYAIVDAPRELLMIWRFDIFLAPGERPYDVPIRITLAPTPSGGTRMKFRQGSLATGAHTKGSRDGVEQNLRYLAAALGE